MGKDFAIGTQFKTRGKFARLCVVVDIWKTYDSAGKLVKTCYVATHEGPLGQTIVDRDVCATTIAIGIAELQAA